MSERNKYDFIKELLDNPKLNSHQLKRTISLASKEIETDTSFAKKLEERIEKLENKDLDNNNETDIKYDPFDDPQFILHNPGFNAFVVEENQTREGFAKNDNKTTRYLSPINLHEFLYNFNQNPILRTTCHEIDSNEFDKILEFCQTEKYDFNKHREKVQKEFNDKFYENDIYFVSPVIKALIKAYLTGEKYNGEEANWTEDSIKFNWNSPELINWSKDNPGLVPHPNDGFKKEANNKKEFIIRPSIPIKLIESNEGGIRKFKDLVLHFKNLFHIKGENSLFKIISNENVRNIDYWSNIDFVMKEETFPTNLTFFTNVEKLIQAYRKLIGIIVDVHKNHYKDRDKEMVELKLGYNKNKELEFSIFHKDSTFQKDITALIENNDGQSFGNLIKNQINGLCDFYIEADFNPKESFKVNLWNGKKREKILLNEKVGGVKYILILKAVKDDLFNRR